MTVQEKAADFIKKFEGFSPTAKWDVNAFRLGYGSDTIELPNGTFRKVLSSDVTTESLASKDLARRISSEFIPRVKKQIGAEGWNKLPIPSQVALLSLAYNYGSITKQPIIDAAKIADVKLLAKKIVESTYNDNASQSEAVRSALRNRRAMEAEYALTDLGGNKKIVIAIGGLLLLTAIVGIFIYRNKIISMIDKKI